MSIATIVTRGYGSFGSVNFIPTWGYSLGEAAEVSDVELLGGGPGYSYLTPYQKYLDAKRQSVEVKEAIDHAAIERKALQNKLESALKSKAKKAAETQRKLELQLQQIEKETLLLIATLQRLNDLMRLWDEEDALLALAMASPFATIQF